MANKSGETDVTVSSTVSRGASIKVSSPVNSPATRTLNVDLTTKGGQNPAALPTAHVAHTPLTRSHSKVSTSQTLLRIAAVAAKSTCLEWYRSTSTSHQQ
ncbi:hypothetical protein OS493_027726 [Desmophyllum pertusum]|uniref:Uncharacterized protein n=1 Tax=Desmophyllum pertusum TaxID=174260 RepID=A0A9W9ZBS7_9CNID|nr:hypothetical protein OS493_027726 [Desmophyllum pertusum]